MTGLTPKTPAASTVGVLFIPPGRRTLPQPAPPPRAFGADDADILRPASVQKSAVLDDRQQPGPEPPPAPANLACFSGVGSWAPTGGKKTQRVAFRVEVEDRSELGTGKLAPDDYYRIRIWIPVAPQTPASLANLVCCTLDQPSPEAGIPGVDDGGRLISGNIQIHPQTPNSTEPHPRCEQP